MIILMAALGSPGPPDMQWHRMPNLFLGTFNAAASMSGEKIVVTGGIGQGGGTLNWVQVLNPGKNYWSSRTRFSVSRCNHAQATLLDGRILIVGGKTGYVTKKMAATASAELIDLTTSSAVAMPDLPHAVAGPTSHLLASGKVLVIGGRSAAVFDPATEQWSQFINLRQSRSDHASLLMDDGKVLVAGGAGCKTLELIDVDNSASQQLSVALPFAMDDLALAPLDAGRAWVLGGQDTRTGETTDKTWIIDMRDPRKAVLTPGPSLGIAGGVADQAVAVLHNWIFMLGGESEVSGHDTELDEARILGRATQQVWKLPAMSVPHDDAVALIHGRGVVIIGGYYRRKSPFGNFRIPTATTIVESLQLPVLRLKQDH